MKQEIHISDLRTFKQCRRKWAWSSPLQQNLESNVPYAPFFTGRAIHFALEMFYGKSHHPFQVSLGKFFEHERAEMEKEGRLWPGEESQFAEQTELVYGMMDHYGLWVKGLEGHYADSNLEFLSLETTFSTPLYNPLSGRKSTKVYLAGRFDGLVRIISDNTYWIWETKSTRSINELIKSLVNDEQAGAYLWAAEKVYKVPIVGVLYNILRKKVPTKPLVLQNGFLSKNKRIDTTANAYFDAIHENHPDMDMTTIREFYGDMLDYLLTPSDDVKPFFARWPVFRTKTEIDTLAANLHATALEMTRPQTVLYPTPGWMNCNFCHFRTTCLAMNAGSNFGDILTDEYRLRSKEALWRMELEEEIDNEAH